MKHLISFVIVSGITSPTIHAECFDEDINFKNVENNREK